MQLGTRKVLTMDAVKHIVEAAKAHGASKGHDAMILVVVDAGAHPLYLERMDGIPHGTVDVAITKAQSSANFSVPSSAFREAVNEGNLGLVGMPGMAPYYGAVPIMLDGECLGAIAISGIDEAMDAEIAQAGADALVKLVAG